MIRVKRNIYNILPIVLSIILPGVGLFTNMDPDLLGSVNIFMGWFFVSTLLYHIWYILWFLWDITHKFKERWLLLSVTIGSMLFFAFLIGFLVEEKLQFRPHHLARFFFLATLFLSIQYALKAQQSVARLLLEKEQIQTENYRVQLRVLRAQIDPHFLFNSLNTLRSMVRQQHTNSEKFIISLSQFYRQTLKHNENTTLRLVEELDVLESYLFLMKNRNEAAIDVQVNIDKELYPFHLPSLALQVVVENCFKHNVMTSKKPLKIDISNTDDFYVVVTNNLQPKMDKNESSGFGLEVIKKRYELMKVKQGIIIQKTPDQFIVKLKLIS